MPNHVANELIVLGTSAELRFFERFARGVPVWWKNSEKPEIIKHLELSQFIHPEPASNGQEVSIPYSSMATPEKLDGYQWCIENWGTKWGTYDCILIDEETAGEGTLCYQFNTAWNPFNHKVGEAMSKAFPCLRFHLSYFETGMGFQGHRTWNSSGIESKGEQTGSILDCNFMYDCMVTSG